MADIKTNKTDIGMVHLERIKDPELKAVLVELVKKLNEEIYALKVKAGLIV